MVAPIDTAAPDPQVRVRIIHGDATIRDDKVIRLSELKTIISLLVNGEIN